MRSSLGIAMELDGSSTSSLLKIVPLPQSPLKSRDAARVCSLYCAYRFAEILALKGGQNLFRSTIPKVPVISVVKDLQVSIF